MGKKIETDWDKIKAFYIQRVPIKEIADTFGVKECTIHARIRRKGWEKLRQEVSDVVSKGLQKERARYDMKAAAERIREKLAIDAEGIVAELEKRKTAKLTLSELETRERIAASVQKRAWTAMGLDQPGSGAVINVAVMASLIESHESARIGPGSVVEAEVIGEKIAPQAQSFDGEQLPSSSE